MSDNVITSGKFSFELIKRFFWVIEYIYTSYLYQKTATTL
jgi:hypothetical protein